MQNVKIFQQLCEQLACNKLVELLYGKKQQMSLNEIRCSNEEGTTKMLPPNRLQLNTACYELLL